MLISPRVRELRKILESAAPLVAWADDSALLLILAVLWESAVKERLLLYICNFFVFVFGC